jgi:hypothetical protein
MVQAPREPLLVAAFTKVGIWSAPFAARLAQGQLAQAGSKIVNAVQDLRMLVKNGTTHVQIEQLARAFERETSELKMQSYLEKMVSLGGDGIQRLAVMHKTAVMRAANSDILAQLRRRILGNILIRVVRNQFKDFVAPEKILNQMLIAQMISDHPGELRSMAECFAAYGTLGERYFKHIFQSGGTVVDENGTRNFNRFVISADVYLDQLDADLEAEEEFIVSSEKYWDFKKCWDFKLTTECLQSLRDHAVDSHLRSRALELIFKLRCRE